MNFTWKTDVYTTALMSDYGTISTPGDAAWDLALQASVDALVPGGKIGELRWERTAQGVGLYQLLVADTAIANGYGANIDIAESETNSALSVTLAAATAGAPIYCINNTGRVDSSQPEHAGAVAANTVFWGLVWGNGFLYDRLGTVAIGIDIGLSGTTAGMFDAWTALVRCGIVTDPALAAAGMRTCFFTGAVSDFSTNALAAGGAPTGAIA